jgi:hypothetical protein
MFSRNLNPLFPYSVAPGSGAFILHERASARVLFFLSPVKKFLSSHQPLALYLAAVVPLARLPVAEQDRDRRHKLNRADLDTPARTPRLAVRGDLASMPTASQRYIMTADMLRPALAA